MNKKKSVLVAAIFISAVLAKSSNAQQLYREKHRPQVHFSPKEKWTNDPNGMVYHNGIYHLFFQYYPGSTIWGPMHWGHATSTDLVHWQEQPIALYPDSLGYIFSGSAVVDKNNTSGFGKNGQVPLVAIFTHHDPKGEKEGRNNFQHQSIAYSLDNGKTWTKYAGNPVLKNPGITDFRDPKVMWYEPQKKWVMTLATKDHITFYSSPDLKNWTKESEFGKELGAHGGVWECPDLFTLNDHGKQVWVLIVNLNPGGPNGGSATQYFLGAFDGKQFTPFDTTTKWLDYGPDEYAGISWANTGNRKVFLGWMSNWQYANVVPTETWRNAMTIPRELKLKRIGKEMYVASEPVAELNKIRSKPVTLQNIPVKNSFDVVAKTGKVSLPARVDLNLEQLRGFSILLSNDAGEEVVIGYDEQQQQYFIDRTKSGKTDFHKDFAGRHVAPRLTSSGKLDCSLIIDVSSLELFADGGLTVMTETFFPTEPFKHIRIQSPGNTTIKKLTISSFRSIW
ncbi:glycoside hydrolase family 32 protein [Pseudoflavitalea sp. X16]|uniref:glycoside hydrolase family 32 protein n=1 Tax=Paraflavitalea devenefica TaxID=2716334 RepID=UPI001421ED78|nr:glycoside hydrolase family 32 protein [Paraflavitalea devenefica]NII25902.1 glycoside hydrolase family 32 protein [Paraflavitalea devenefica]